MHMSSTWGLCPQTPTPSAGPDFSDAIHFTTPRKDMRITDVKPPRPSEYPRQDVKPPHCPRQDVKRHWLSTQGLRPRTPTPSAGPDFSDAKSSPGPTESHLNPQAVLEQGSSPLKRSSSRAQAPSSGPRAGLKPPQAVLERGSSFATSSCHVIMPRHHATSSCHVITTPKRHW
jgi:hypothetical protein